MMVDRVEAERRRKPRGIYVHLPFCKTKCPYCDFASFAKEDDKRQAYINALTDEIDHAARKWNIKQDLIDTIFFGGGTPSVHSKEELGQVIQKVREYFKFSSQIEVTLEANPGTIDKQKLEDFIDLGINRISFGAQSFDPILLEKLGRGHSVEDSYVLLDSLIDLYKHGKLVSWSFDLIYGLPGQSLDSWLKTLEIALAYDPPHISAYCLSIEENTPYGKIYKNSSHQTLPQEDDLIQMYEEANRLFATKDLRRYEISNWAKPGHEARHNLIYWRAQEYYAFGLSAHGYVDSIRYENTRNLDHYVTARGSEEIQLISSKINEEEQVEEKIMLGLRLAEGLELDESIKAHINWGQLTKLKESGFIEGEQRIKLTDKAQMLSNRIISELCYH